MEFRDQLYPSPELTVDLYNFERSASIEGATIYASRKARFRVRVGGGGEDLGKMV
jgi:hypothetical protein